RTHDGKIAGKSGGKGEHFPHQLGIVETRDPFSRHQHKRNIGKNIRARRRKPRQIPSLGCHGRPKEWLKTIRIKTTETKMNNLRSSLMLWRASRPITAWLNVFRNPICRMTKLIASPSAPAGASTREIA